jgi:ferredoxin
MAFKITDECVACGTCVDECPNGAIAEEGEKYVIKTDLCKVAQGEECGKCKEVCPTEAIVEA